MHLEKRKKPGSMRLEIEAGWEYLFFDFGNGEKEIYISSSLGCSFNELLRILIVMYSRIDRDNGFTFGNWLLEERLYGKDWDWVDGTETVHNKLSLSWNEEGSFSNWILELTDDNKVKVSITMTRGDEMTLRYKFSFQDLCYIVADALTKTIKEYGFNGFAVSSYGDEFDLRGLLLIKAIALGCEDDILSFKREKGDYKFKSDLDTEIEILMFDM